MLCPDDKVVLTCITDTCSVVWEADNGAVTELTHLTQPTIRGSLNLNVTAVNGNMITSTATIESVTV